MSKQHFPPGWDEARVQRVIDHYKNISDDEMIAEDEAAHKAGRNREPVSGAARESKDTVRGARRPKRGKQPKTKPFPFLQKNKLSY